VFNSVKLGQTARNLRGKTPKRGTLDADGVRLRGLQAAAVGAGAAAVVPIVRVYSVASPLVMEVYSYRLLVVWGFLALWRY